MGGLRRGVAHAEMALRGLHKEIAELAKWETPPRGVRRLEAMAAVTETTESCIKQEQQELSTSTCASAAITAGGGFWAFGDLFGAFSLQQRRKS